MEKVILSGTGQGMSCSIARVLKEKGYSAHLFSRSEFGEDLAKELGFSHSKVDLLSYSEVKESVDTAIDKMQGLTAMVHAAGGFYGFKEVDGVDEMLFEDALMNNAKTFFNIVKASVPYLSDMGGGSITVLTAAPNVFTNGHIGYAAGKGAVTYMVKQLARELSGQNIRVNAIAPGFFDKQGCLAPKKEQGLLMKGRYSGIHIANAVSYVIESRLLTGQIIEVDGGHSSIIGPGL